VVPRARDGGELRDLAGPGDVDVVEDEDRVRVHADGGDRLRDALDGAGLQAGPEGHGVVLGEGGRVGAPGLGAHGELEVLRPHVHG